MKLKKSVYLVIKDGRVLCDTKDKRLALSMSNNNKASLFISQLIKNEYD